MKNFYPEMGQYVFLLLHATLHFRNTSFCLSLKLKDYETLTKYILVLGKQHLALFPFRIGALLLLGLVFLSWQSL